MKDDTLSEHTTYCRNCAAQCGIIVRQDSGHITGIRGDADHPISQGYFCVKGLSSIDFHNGEDRLQQCVQRTADGQFKPVQTDAALDAIHEKLSAIIGESGPESVALYYGTGANLNSLTHSAMKAWTEAIGTPFIYSSMTLDQSAKWVTAGRMGAFLPGKHRAPHADVILIAGSNPVVSHASFAAPAANVSKVMRDARADGMKLITIDPRDTETSRHADIHVKIRPGEDATLFAGLIKYVLEHDLQDQTFCDRFVSSVETLRAAVEPFTLDYVSERTDVPIETLEGVARTFSEAKRKSAHSGTGTNMGPRSNLTEHLMEALNAICGGYAQRGDTVRYFNAYFGDAGAQEMVVPPNRSWETGSKCHSTDIGPLCGEYPAALLPKEIQNKGSGSIRALIVVGGNLAKALSDPDVSLPALGDLDLLVTLEQRSTETGRLSDYQIATSLPYERIDYNGAVNYILPAPFAQIAKPILDRPVNVIEDWEFFAGLAKRAGQTLHLKQSFFGLAQDHIPGPSFELSPERDYTTDEIVRWMTSQGTCSYDELMSNPHGLLQNETEQTVAAAAPGGANLDVCPKDVELEISELRADPLGENEFPFRLLSRRILEVMNSMYTRSSKARSRYPHNPLFMSEEDMHRLALENDMNVSIRSRHGTVTACVRLDRGLSAGTVSMSHCWGDPIDDESSSFSGSLVSLEHDLQTINYMPLQSAIPVEIMPVQA